MITTGEIIELLVDRVADISAADLVMECGNLGMRQVCPPSVDVANQISERS